MVRCMRTDDAAPPPTTTTGPSGLLQGKRLLITGVATTDSIAHAVCTRAAAAGAALVLTCPERDRQRAEDAAAELAGVEAVLTVDATDPHDLASLTDDLQARWGSLDGVLHAIAFAPRAALGGEFLDAPAEDVLRAFHTSTFTYASLAAVLARLAPPGGGSIVGLDFDAAGAWPVYNWMGVCKAALESVSRYVARDLGHRRIRSNLVAAGPLHTRAAGGIPEFRLLTDAYEATAPVPWNADDPGPTADAVCYLLSDLSSGVTGEILHVDGGFHAMATALRSPADRPREVHDSDFA